MARHYFGQSLTDWTMVAGADDQVLLEGGVNITFWSAAVGGSQHTDLLDGSGTPTTFITSADGTGSLPKGTIPRFQGPDSGVAVMWADAGGGARYLMTADIGGTLTEVAALAATVTALQEAVSALATVASTGEYDDLIGAPTLAPVATSGAYTDLSGAPAPGLQIVIKVGAAWPTRAGSAPDTGRPAMWIGPAPAPPAGGGYALETDLWVATP